MKAGRNVKAGRNRIVGASCIVPIVILYCFCIGGKGLVWGIFFSEF